MMRAMTFGSLLLVVLTVGCNSSETAAPGQAARGRYAGIGTFDAGPLWAHHATTAPADPATARLGDDEHIVVVIDSVSGEVRQCGDQSGYCVSINPWRGAAAALPTKLDKHAADLAHEEQEKTRGDAK